MSQKTPFLHSQRGWRQRLRDARLPLILVGITLLALVITWLMLEPPPPRQLKMATGSQAGAYHRFGQAYQAWLKEEEISLRLENTTGSTRNLELLRSGQVDAALVQAGTASPEDEASLQSLGSLYYEPLWVLTRGPSPITQLRQLKGKRLAIGPQGSGTRAVALELLALNGVTPENSPLSPLGGPEAAQALASGEVEGLFMVSSPRAQAVRDLVALPQVHLMSFERSRAYTRRLRYLSGVEVTQGMLDLEHNLPPRDVQLLAPTANLVVRKDLHPALVSLLLSCATQIHAQGEFLEEPGQFPSPHLVQIPLGEDARRFFQTGPSFLQRYLPFWAASLLDRLKFLLLPILTILLPLLRFAPPLYRWRVRHRVARWYEVLREIDQRTQSGKDTLRADLELLDRVEEEVAGEKIPTSYMDEFYELQVHLAFVRTRLEDRLRLQAARQAPTPPSGEASA